jgi:hypothetical protein
MIVTFSPRFCRELSPVRAYYECAGKKDEPKTGERVATSAILYQIPNFVALGV